MQKFLTQFYHKLFRNWTTEIWINNKCRFTFNSYIFGVVDGIQRQMQAAQIIRNSQKWNSVRHMVNFTQSTNTHSRIQFVPMTCVFVDLMVYQSAWKLCVWDVLIVWRLRWTPERVHCHSDQKHICIVFILYIITKHSFYQSIICWK